MGSREIPGYWADGNEKFKPGSNFRKSLAETWRDETLAKVASQVSDPDGGSGKATSKQINDLYIGTTGAGAQRDAYTYMYGRYHAILGDGAQSKLNPGVTYQAWDTATLRKNFGTPGGTGMDNLVVNSSGRLMAFVHLQRRPRQPRRGRNQPHPHQGRGGCRGC